MVQRRVPVGIIGEGILNEIRCITMFCFQNTFSEEDLLKIQSSSAYLLTSSSLFVDIVEAFESGGQTVKTKLPRNERDEPSICRRRSDCIFCVQVSNISGCGIGRWTETAHKRTFGESITFLSPL